MNTKYYKCDACGQVIAVIKKGIGTITCCNKEMTEIIPKMTDKGLMEKHVPTYERKKDKITVKVGNILHPSNKDHYIEWVSLVTNKGFYFKTLKPKEEPEVTFNVDSDEEVEEISSYCNLHSLYTFAVFNKKEDEDEDCGCTITY